MIVSWFLSVFHNRNNEQHKPFCHEKIRAQKDGGVTDSKNVTQEISHSDAFFICARKEKNPTVVEQETTVVQ